MLRVILLTAVLALGAATVDCNAGNPFKAYKQALEMAKQMKLPVRDGQSDNEETEEAFSEEIRQAVFPAEQFEKMRDPVLHTYSCFDMTLMELGWSLVEDKKTVMCEFDKNCSLVIETKKDDITTIIATDLEIVPEEQTLLRFDFKVSNINDKSRVGVVVNYVDDDNYDGILFDKKFYYVVNCKAGKTFVKKKDKLTLPASPVAISFNRGKIEFMLYDKKYGNFIDLWTIKGDLKSVYVGIYVSGKNKVKVSDVNTAQQIRSDDDIVSDSADE